MTPNNFDTVGTCPDCGAPVLFRLLCDWTRCRCGKSLVLHQALSFEAWLNYICSLDLIPADAFIR
jgi:hypothetical protein